MRRPTKTLCIGSGVSISLTPGSSLYFRKPVSDSNFKSNIKELIIPERPLLSTSLSDPVTVSPVPVEIVFPGPVTGFSEDDIYVSNGTADSLTGNYTAYTEYTGSGPLPGYEILDLKGITVGQGLLTGKYSLIAVHELPAGMYLLKLNCDGYFMEPIWFLKE